MEDKNVDSLLRLVGLRASDDSSHYDYSLEGNISRLMNITLQCLGAIRMLAVEQEKKRVAKDSCDIDGTCRDDGRKSLLQRTVFNDAVRTMLDTIAVAKDIDALDPTKDIIESFPWSETLMGDKWLTLPWSIVSNVHDLETDNIDVVKNVMKYNRDCDTEIDKIGQNYLAYVVRSGSMDLLDYCIDRDKYCIKFKDGTGKYPIHYAAAHSQTCNQLYGVIEAMKGQSLESASTNYKDDRGNILIHCAAGGNSCVEVLKEILFAHPECAKIINNEGKLPLHIAACNTNLEKVKMIFSAFPSAINTADSNGWLPLHHAAFTGKSVDVVRFIYERFPEAMNKPHQSGRLPHHYCAVQCNSSKVLQYLIEIYPDGVKTFDVNRRLPIHNAIARCTYMTPARLRCLRLLLEAYPHGASMAGKDGRTPLDLARRDNLGDLVLRLLLRADPNQDPQALGEISYLASKNKYKDRYRDYRNCIATMTTESLCLSDHN